jgi:hypothetical protein
MFLRNSEGLVCWASRQPAVRGGLGPSDLGLPPPNPSSVGAIPLWKPAPDCQTPAP